MAGKAGKSGRRPGLNPMRHPLRTRIDSTLYKVFQEMFEEQVALLPRGKKCTEAEFLRMLILEGAERRGKLLPVETRSPAATTAGERHPPKPKATKAKRTKHVSGTDPQHTSPKEAP
jgi:hypothetical protein